MKTDIFRGILENVGSLFFLKFDLPKSIRTISQKFWRDWYYMTCFTCNIKITLNQLKKVPKRPKFVFLIGFFDHLATSSPELYPDTDVFNCVTVNFFRRRAVQRCNLRCSMHSICIEKAFKELLYYSVYSAKNDDYDIHFSFLVHSIKVEISLMS